MTSEGAAIPSAGTITLGSDGNYFNITGTNAINGILTAGWEGGTKIALRLPTGITITNNSGTPGVGAVSILLRAGANLTTSAPYLLELYFDGTNWIQPN
jgi:hypothetical protein